MIETNNQYSERGQHQPRAKSLSKNDTAERETMNAIKSLDATMINRVQMNRIKDAYNQLKAIHARKVERKKQIIHAIRNGQETPSDVGDKWYQSDRIVENQALSFFTTSVLDKFSTAESIAMKEAFARLNNLRQEELDSLDLQISDLRKEEERKKSDSAKVAAIRNKLKQ